MAKFLRTSLSLLFLLPGILISFSAKSYTNTCNNGRYINRNYFDSVVVTPGIQYGSNDSATGSGTQILLMDVYQPYGDTQKLRPLIIFAFGGSFITGDRSQVTFLCDSFAKLGYVTVGIDYRYAFGAVYPPGPVNVTLEVLRAAQDMKAAVRYFKKDAAINGNVYGVDTNLIIDGGLSAGAITAIHAAYLTDTTTLPAYITPQDTVGFGGIEGNSGSPGYSSKVAGVISYSGAIGDTLWIQSGDIPIFSVHDSSDPTVPFGTDTINIEGQSTHLVASGDGAINTYLNRIGGVRHQILTYNQGWHVDYLSNDQLDSVINLTAQFLVDSLSVCEITYAEGINNVATPAFSIYPNPASGFFNVETASLNPWNMEVFNTLGQSVLSKYSATGNYQANTSGLAPGIYLVKLYDAETLLPLHTSKLVINQ